MKQLLGSITAVLLVLVFAGAAFAQAPREIAPPQEVSGPQETKGPQTENPEDKVYFLVPSTQPFPNVYSGGGMVLYAREGVHLANPFNVSFLAAGPFYSRGNVEEIIREEFLTRDIPIPLPLVGGEKHLLLRIEMSEDEGGLLIVVYYTPVNNVLFEK